MKKFFDRIINGYNTEIKLKLGHVFILLLLWSIVLFVYGLAIFGSYWFLALGIILQLFTFVLMSILDKNE